MGRIQASRLALTWSCPTDLDQHPFDKVDLDTLKDMIKAIEVGSPKIEEFLLAKELHESGKSHYHGYLRYTSRLNVRDMRTWDIERVHPNIKTVSDWRGWVKYCMKDGTFIQENVPMGDVDKVDKEERKGAWKAALAAVAESCNPNDGADILRRLQPQQWVINSSRIMATLIAESATAHADKFPLAIKTTRWIDDVLNLDITIKNDLSVDLTPTVILVGDTGIGKTEAAKFLLKKAYGDNARILFVNHAEDFKGKSGLYDAFVWDEAAFNTTQNQQKTPWTREQQLAVCGFDNHPRTLHTRHSNVVIPPGIPRIFTCNYLNRCVDADDPAIARRIHVVNFGARKLFKTE